MLDKVLSVTKRQPEMVSPALETRSNSLYLTEMDHLGAIYMANLSVYENYTDEKGIGTNPAKVLKEALARALVYYYPVAGRLKAIEDENRLLVNCNSEGVVFVEAQADCTLADVSYFKGHYNLCEYSPLLPEVDVSQPLEQLPFLAMQVTTFKCRGFVVGTYLTHRMMDAAGFSQFFKDFAEMAREGSLSSPPIWERHRLAPRDREMPRVIEEDSASPAPCLASTKPATVCEMFCIPGDVIDAQKLSVVRESSEVLSYCSTFEALLTLIWTTYAETVGLEDEEDIGFHFVVNGRRALSKVLPPEGYYGNCVAGVDVNYEDLRISDKGVRLPNSCEIVEATRRAMKKVDEEYMWSWISQLSYARITKQMFMIDDKMIFNDWSKFDWIPDFGIGKGIRVVNPLESICPKNPLVVILPKEEDYNGFRVGIFLQEENMPAFKASFAKYADN